MLNGDALLSFLASIGRGSWQTFERAAEDVTSTVSAYQCARALCSHGLVEFDWLGDRSWTVSPLSVIRVARNRFFAIGLLDESLSKSLREAGFAIKFQLIRTRSPIAYTLSEILDADCLGIQRIEQVGDFYIEPTTVDAGLALLSALPQLGAAIDSRPIVPLEEAIRGDEVRFLSDDLKFIELSHNAGSRLNFEMIRVKRQFAAPDYYYVDRQGARRIELELALSYAAARLGLKFLHHSHDVAALSARVPVPILVERAMHFSGAHFIGIKHSRDNGEAYACFTGVSTFLLRSIATKLLTSLSPLPDLGDLP
jgi:hypothetical protein